MKAWLEEELANDKIKIMLVPLIDCVFVLLIYFMVTGSLVRKEGDISFVLPASMSQQEPVNMPVEAMIEISANGTVQVEGMQYAPTDRLLNDLVTLLQGLKQIAVSQSCDFSVNLVPEGETVHERIIEVMDACAAAGVKNLTFGKSI